MKRFGIGVIGLLLGYLIAAVAGYFPIGVLSSNAHDRTAGISSSAMTGALAWRSTAGIRRIYAVGFRFTATRARFS
jgi:hypothetical protein